MSFGATPHAALASDRPILAVSELTSLIQSLLEGDPRLRQVYVKGEISNFKHHPSGHMYFTLKDETSRLACVMFRGRNANLTFRPEDGLSVIAGGRISVYGAGGNYQLYVETLVPTGQGELYLAFEQLKAKLAAAGLFAPERKRPLPSLPRVVGVVTSPSGAALRDMISVMRRRYPNIDILIAPAIVQGEAGPESVVRALEQIGQRPEVDVVIVGRGGGSLEELWTFNDERVARAIARCPVPVISAVGHETDFTIADFVADRRAPTPSAAAELVVPERARLQRQLDQLRERAIWALQKRLADSRLHLEQLRERAAFRRPAERIELGRERLATALQKVARAVLQRHERAARDLELAAGKLNSLSPLATLSRGYAICCREDGQVVKRIADAPIGARVEVVLRDGALACEVRRRLAGEPGAAHRRPAAGKGENRRSRAEGEQPALPLGE